MMPCGLPFHFKPLDSDLALNAPSRTFANFIMTISWLLFLISVKL